MKRLSEPQFIVSLPLVIVVGVILLTETLHHLYQRNLQHQLQADTTAFAADLRSRAEVELGGVLHITSGLSSYLSVRHASLEQHEMENILRATFLSGNYIRNLGVALGYRLTYVYPVQGNEAAIGLDYREQPHQWPAVEQAINSRKPVMAEQVVLVQGGTAFIYREPIFIDGEYWGLLSTVVDSDEFLKNTFGSISRSDMDFAVKGTSGKLLWGSEDIFANQHALVLGSERGWQFAVVGRESGQFFLLNVLRMLGWGLALALAFGLYNLLSHKRTLAHMALHDVVTGLPNRRLFNERLHQAFALALKYKRPGPVLIFLDINNFKQINDSYGHQAGDFVLQTLGQRLVFCAPAGASVARWAGDEFVLLLDSLTEAQLKDLMQRLKKAVGEPLYLQGQSFSVSAAMGYARAFVDARTPEELVAAADRQMYQLRQRQLAAGG